MPHSAITCKTDTLGHGIRPRLSAEQFSAIRDNGGVAQITAYRSYLAAVDPKITAAVEELSKELYLTASDERRAPSPETLSRYSRGVATVVPGRTLY